MLWFFFPLLWPGGYLFYLGRDTHCFLQTVTFGGFGLGWLVDGLMMPLYVQDVNEGIGYLGRADRRHSSWWTLNTLLLPATLLLQLVIALYFGAIGYHLVPQPLVLPAALSEGSNLPPLLSDASSAALAFCAGMLGVALGVRLAAESLGRVRLRIRPRQLMGWAVGASALILGTQQEHEALDEEEVESRWVQQLFLGSLASMAGAARGRAFAPRASPRRAARRYVSARLVLQLVGVGTFAAAALGSFYLNGSFTHTMESGERVTYSGAEALPLAWQSVCELSGDIKAAASQAYGLYSRMSWPEIWASLQEAFKDPAKEAAEVLGVPIDADTAEVKGAHRRLARVHHPDKVRGEVGVDFSGQVEQAKVQMQRINWAKEVLLAGGEGRRGRRRRQKE